VLLTALYPPVLGGAELQAQSLARELNSLGARVMVLTRRCPGSALHDRDQGIEVLRALSALSLGPLWGLTYMWSAHRWLRRLAARWDLIHVQQIGLHAWPSLRIARALSRPCLLRCSSFGAGGDLAVLRAQGFGRLQVAELRHASRVVALTPAGAAEVLRYAVPAERVRVIPNGVDLRRFSPQAWVEERDDDPMRLLFVGRLSREKGLDVLLEALKHADAARFSLRVVGAGAEASALAQQVRELGLGASVEFIGPSVDVVSQYRWSELVVVPSRFEGMPNVALEAMACARPVLATRVNGTRDVVTEGRDGWLVDSENPLQLAAELQRLRHTRVILREAGRRARASVESAYSISRAASRYMYEYEAMLVEHSQGRA
jgi:glycosyltransferase involved in cell wall biosynthesis